MNNINGSGQTWMQILFVQLHHFEIILQQPQSLIVVDKRDITLSSITNLITNPFTLED